MVKGIPHSKQDTVKPMSELEVSKITRMFFDKFNENKEQQIVEHYAKHTTVLRVVFWGKTLNSGGCLSATICHGKIESIMFTLDGYKHSINFRFENRTKYIVLRG